MTNVIKIKRSAVAGAAPSTLEEGEIALNTADRKLFFRTASGTIASFSLAIPDLTAALAAKLDGTAYTAADVLTKIKTVDGAGSGLDADLLDGVAPSAFGLARLADANATAARTGLGAAAAGVNTDITSLSLTALGVAGAIFCNSGTAGLPTFTTRSGGTRIVLYPSLSAGALDAAIGLGGTEFWFSANAATSSFRFYAGSTTPAVTLGGNGIVTATGFVGDLSGNADSATTATKLAGVTPSAYGLSLLDDTDAATARTTLGLGTAATAASTAFAAAAHGHAVSDVTGLQAALDAKLPSASYTAADVLTKIKTVDGSGSGLDADLLDGVAPSAFGLARLSDANATAARTGLGAAAAGVNTDITSLSGLTALGVAGVISCTGGEGGITLANGTRNSINWGAVGAGAPSFTARSAGTKLLLWPNISASTVDYAIGIQQYGMWFSVHDSSAGWRFYAGTTAVTTIDGTGKITASEFAGKLTGTADNATTAASAATAAKLAGVTPSAYGLSLLDDTDAATARTTLGLGTAATAASTAFAPAAHGHAVTDVTGLQSALDAKLPSASYTAADVLTKIKTVDGSGSGLDADLLDGVAPSAFGLARLSDANAAAARSGLGAAASGANTDITSLGGLTTALSVAQGGTGATTAAIARSNLGLVPLLVQPGTVCFFAQASAPNGWLKANGAWVSRTLYADLFAAIGVIHGVGDGSTSFSLPDLRGMFIRALDDGRGVDPSRSIGTWQGAMLEAHQHVLEHIYLPGGGLYAWIPTNGTSSGVRAPTQTTGGGETRPQNVALLACIKF